MFQKIHYFLFILSKYSKSKIRNSKSLKYFLFIGILFYIFTYYLLIYLNQKDYKTEYSSNKNKKNLKINACIIALIRNWDIYQFSETISRFEKNFNNKYQYPYIFFNDEPFDDNFKNKIKILTKSSIEFVQVSKEAWSFPKWIQIEKYLESLKVIPFKENYRHMCRFYSGFFFRENATLKYDYYMRIDRESIFPCPVKEDPFKRFENDKNLMYGFAVGSGENLKTVETLWPTIKQWLDKDDNNNKNKMPQKNESMLSFISNDNGASLTYNCIFYNNFEIARFSLFRSKTYLSFFEHLDKAGGFYYERWGDAPVHTIYVSLMLKKSQVHLFSDIIPYEHNHVANFIINNSKCIQNLDCKYSKKYFLGIKQSNFILHLLDCLKYWLSIKYSI
jgi:alpha 1,2-mannosyltransferase